MDQELGSRTNTSTARRVAVSLAAVVALGAIGGGALFFENRSNPVTSATAVPAPPLEFNAPLMTIPPAPVSPTVTEPVAEVARVLGPSVVQVETDQGQGSGVVFREGLILTNNHVIDGTSQVQVRLADGRVVAAELVGRDARIDIAVLRVGEVDDLPVAELALDGELGVGHLVVAIGSPFQLQQTVTAGVVSAINRPVPNDVAGANAMIQTDTAINPGNSGGALADRLGRVVGINTSGRTDGNSNSNIGIGFAVPIETAVATADRLLAGESMAPGVLGVSPGAGESSTSVGVLLGEVSEGGAAAAAGLEPGDRIVSIDGVAVPSAEVLVAIVQNHFAGDELELEVDRAGEDLLLSVILD